jgi:hypothetical protein
MRLIMISRWFKCLTYEFCLCYYQLRIIAKRDDSRLFGAVYFFISSSVTSRFLDRDAHLLFETGRLESYQIWLLISSSIARNGLISNYFLSCFGIRLFSFYDAVRYTVKRLHGQ